jgi:hypothetical protein
MADSNLQADFAGGRGHVWDVPTAVIPSSAMGALGSALQQTTDDAYKTYPDANKAKAEVDVRLTPRLLSDDMIGLKQAKIAGLGIVAFPERSNCRTPNCRRAA